ncbi:formin-binding protein [Coemansia sp. RSA 455]|nr:formin-binding protein [Coemansia sp. RSA 455]
MGKDASPPAHPHSNGADSGDAGSTLPGAGTVTSVAGMSVAETDAELSAEFVSSARFSESFWSTDERCISVLMHKLKAAKQTSNDILQLITTRATMEEDLGKRLGKVAKSALGSEEVGSIKEALRTVRAEMESSAKTHSDLARQLRSEIERPLSAFINDQRNKRRAQTTIIQKTEGDRNALRSQLRKLQEKRRADTKRVGDLDLQVNGLQGTADPKLRTKLERAQMQQRATEAEYIDVRARLKDADAQWFNVWRAACDVFQVLEEQRIEYLKTTLWTYTNLVSSSCVADDESMERIRQDLELINVADDIAAFIQTFGTGSPDPSLQQHGSQSGSKKHSQADADIMSTSSPSAAAATTAANPAMITPVTSSSASAATAVPIPAYAAAAQTPSTGGYRPSTPSSIGHAHTFNSVSTATNGTTRSGSLLAHTPQDSLRQHTRPASMHAASAGSGPQQQQQPPLAMQAQQLLNGSANWNSRPASSMQGSISSNHSYRRASNSDMYTTAQQQQQHQQQHQPQHQQYMDPRAPSSIGGMYQQHGTNSPTPIIQQQPPPPHMGSPRSRASTYNGPAAQQSLPPNVHTGNFGTLTANTQPPGIMIPPHQPNSAPSSPYQQSPSHQHPIQPQYQQQHRPMSSAGMHNMAPSPQMGARPGSVMTGHYAPPPVAATPPNVYRSATPVQQSPQYVTNNVANRPPTQMSHLQQPPMGMSAPSPQVYMQQQFQQQQRAPSVMGNNGYHHPQQLHQQMQHHRSASRVDAPSPAPVAPSPASGPSTSESGKEILFYVKVLYDYDAENEKELTIRDGDVISVLAVSADGWWEGEMTDRRTGRPLQGTFPSNFTDPISNLA